ncbi:hypothetical protein [Pseudomonas sediminis]|uniref:hypothetical protein n=1 Tax=Pseudomonas sediminis TaxID=1691904 RepID=UPI0031CCA3FA
MPRLIVELDTDLYRMLQEAARINQLSLQVECVRRLKGGRRRSRYMEALLAELRADDAQRRA